MTILTFGIAVLRNAEGQGRKPIFDTEKEAKFIQQVVKTERQKLENAKLILEKELNKSFLIKRQASTELDGFYT